MCAILGFIGNGPASRADFGLLTEAAWANIRRGPHAWGVAAVRGNRLDEFKQPGDVTKARRGLQRAITGACAFGLHLRWATRGCPTENSNNHPHNFGRGTLIHNGTVTYAEELAEAEGLSPASDCDSEVLAQLLRAQRQRRRIDRVRITAEAARGWSDEGKHQAHAMVATWPDLIVVAKAGKPLAWTDRPEGLYFASLPLDRSWTRLSRDWLFGIKLGRDAHAVAPGTSYFCGAA